MRPLARDTSASTRRRPPIAVVESVTLPCRPGSRSRSCRRSRSSGARGARRPVPGSRRRLDLLVPAPPLQLPMTLQIRAVRGCRRVLQSVFGKPPCAAVRCANLSMSRRAERRRPTSSHCRARRPLAPRVQRARSQSSAGVANAAERRMAADPFRSLSPPLEQPSRDAGRLWRARATRKRVILVVSGPPAHATG